MPAPLIWLGAAAISLYSGNKLNNAYLKKKGVVGEWPGNSNYRVQARNGSVVCCGVYGMLDHTGIWIDGNIVELNGNGLVRAISPERFIHNRSGEEIYVACDADFNPLLNQQAVDACLAQIYSYRDYDVISNNCHRFVAEMCLGQPSNITSFSELNEALSFLFSSAIYWHKSNDR